MSGGLDVSDIPVVTEPDKDYDGEDNVTWVTVSIGCGDVHLSTSANVDGVASPDEIARLLYRVALGAAQSHSTDTAIALQHLIVSVGGNT